MKASYVIFICTFDPFGKGLYRYTFQNRCKECEMVLGDGTWKIFLNTKGVNADEVPESLVHFLKYVENSTDDCVNCMQDTAVLKLHQKVKELKESRKLEVNYMTVEEWMRDLYAEELDEERIKKLEEGRKAGLEEGERKILQLAAALAKDNRANELAKCYSDKKLLETLLKEYHL